jgi:hypothetical protein
MDSGTETAQGAERLPTDPEDRRLGLHVAAGDVNQQVALLPDQRFAVGLGAEVAAVHVRAVGQLLLAQLVLQLGDRAAQLLLLLLKAREAGQHLAALPQVVLQEGVHLPHPGKLFSAQTCGNHKYTSVADP